MSKQRYNPNAAKGNAWQLATDSNFCCEDNNTAEQCKYEVSFPFAEGVISTLDAVVIDGTVYYPDSQLVLKPQDEDNEAIVAFIENALAQAGYMSSDVEVSFENPLYTITANPQQATFDGIVVGIGGTPTEYTFIATCENDVEVDVLVFDDADEDGTFDPGDPVTPLAILRVWDNDAGTGSPLQTTYTGDNGFGTLSLAKPAIGDPAISYYIDVDDSAGAGSGFGSPAPRYKEITVADDGTVTFTGDWVDAPNYPLPPKP